MTAEELRAVVRDAVASAIEPVRAQLDELIRDQRESMRAAQGAERAAGRAADRTIEVVTEIGRLADALDTTRAKLDALERDHRQRCAAGDNGRGCIP